MQWNVYGYSDEPGSEHKEALLATYDTLWDALAEAELNNLVTRITDAWSGTTVWQFEPTEEYD